MLAPRWDREDEVIAARAAFVRDGAVRLRPGFPEARAVDFLRALRSADYRPMQNIAADGGYQLWRYGWVPCQGCAGHPLCDLSRWLFSDAGVGAMSQLTGLELAAPVEPVLSADAARKSSFYEVYDDSGPGRAVAFMAHFVTAPWPAEWGGHMEVLDQPDGKTVATWAPVWNAIDLFDVREPGAWRRMPMLVEHVEGFTVTGYLPGA